MKDFQIHTTSGEVFSAVEHGKLARLVLKRFGGDVAVATAAWRRLLENDCDELGFQDLVELPTEQEIPVYRVTIMVEITSDRSMEGVQEQVEDLLEHGTVQDSFGAAGLDTGYFTVEKVERKKP